MTKYAFLFAGLLCAAVPAFAIESADLVPRKVQIKNDTSYYYNNTEAATTFGRLTADFGGKLFGAATYSFGLQVQYDNLGNYDFGSWNEPQNADARQSAFGLGSFSISTELQKLPGLNWLPGKTQLTVGKARRWGAVTDTITGIGYLFEARDYTRMYADELMPEWGYSVRQYIGRTWHVTAHHSLFTPDRFAAGGPWHIPYPPGVTVNSDPPKTGQVSLRGCYDNRRRGGMQVCTVGYRGNDRLPYLSVRTDDPTVFDLQYERLSAVGGSFLYDYWSTTWRAEYVHRLYDDRSNYGQAVVGFERVFSKVLQVNWLPKWPQLHEGVLLLQYAHQVTPRHDDIWSHTVTKKALSWRVTAGPSNGLYFESIGAYSFGPDGYLVDFIVSSPLPRNWLPTGALRVDLVYGFVGGSKQNLFGQYGHEARRVGLQLTYDWTQKRKRRNRRK